MGVASIPESAAALVAHVDDAELAAWLLRHAKLTEPVLLKAALSGPESLRHLKGDVNRATTAAMSCGDLEALDRFARDSRVTIKRAVAARESLLPATVTRLWEFALKNHDVEIVSGLVDKIDLGVLDGYLAPDAPDVARSLVMQAHHTRIAVLADRLVSAGDWQMFLRAVVATRRHGDAFAAALGRRSPGDPGLEFSDPKSPLNDLSEPLALRLPLAALIHAVKHWDQDRAEWAVALFDAQFEREPSHCRYGVSTYGTHRPSADLRSELQVDDDAAATMVKVLDRETDDLGQLYSRHTDRGVLASLLQRELSAAVASNPRQASRHFDRLVSTSDSEVAVTLIWRAAEDRTALSVTRERKMVGLAARMELANSSESIPQQLGRRVSSDELLPLLRSGELGITLDWLSGRRFSAPTVAAVAELVSDPGRAFNSSRYSSRFNSWARNWWIQVPHPSGWREVSPAASWFIELFEWLDAPHTHELLASEVDEVAHLRQTVTPEMVVAAVDAAGASGVRAALRHPQWLVGRIRQLVGDSLEVWEALVGLAPEWDQNLTELISTSALLSGVALLEPDPEPMAEGDAPVEALVQLSLL